MENVFIVTLTARTPQEAQLLKLPVQSLGTPDDQQRLQEFVNQNLTDAARELPIEELDLSVLSYNSLIPVGINTIGDLLSYSEKRLRAKLKPRSAHAVITEINRQLGRHNLPALSTED